jgi:hypothetical protein
MGVRVVPSQMKNRLVFGEGGEAGMFQENMLEGLGVLDLTQILEESFPPQIAGLLCEGRI